MTMANTVQSMESVVAHALEAAKRSGASQADVLLVESDDREVRVRGDEIEFVKQAQERGLGIRTLVEGTGGLQTAIVSTSDLAPAAIDRMAEEAVALAGDEERTKTIGRKAGEFAEGALDVTLCAKKLEQTLQQAIANPRPRFRLF